MRLMYQLDHIWTSKTKSMRQSRLLALYSKVLTEKLKEPQVILGTHSLLVDLDKSRRQLFWQNT